jgi:hypothetical protein
MNDMNWFRKLAAESVAGWFVDGAFALEAAFPLTCARPWLVLKREFIITF